MGNCLRRRAHDPNQQVDNVPKPLSAGFSSSMWIKLRLNRYFCACKFFACLVFHYRSWWNPTFSSQEEFYVSSKKHFFKYTERYMLLSLIVRTKTEKMIQTLSFKELYPTMLLSDCLKIFLLLLCEDDISFLFTNYSQHLRCFFPFQEVP